MNTGNLLDMLILFGAIQGFITSIILIRSRKNQQSNRLLAGVIFMISLACLNLYFFEVLEGDGSFFQQVLENTISLILIMALGPLLYLYVRSSLGAEFQIRNHRIHFTPVILDLIPSLLSLAFLIAYFLNISQIPFPVSLQNFNERYQKYLDLPRWISVSTYLLLSINIYVKSAAKVKLKWWLKSLMIAFSAFQIVWLLHLIPYLIPSTSNLLLQLVGWYPVYIPLTLLVYWLGINGIIHLQASTQKVSIYPAEAQTTILQLNRLMEEEKLFLKKDLTLDGLVLETGITQKKISASLNQFLGKSFNEYINEFRIIEVKKRLADPSYNHLTITGIAFDCGFNSQATFQRTFKSIMNDTPKSFRSISKIPT
jgi:AraC-like DNA-binding protein